MNAKLRLLPHALLATTVAGPAAVLSFDSVRQAAEPHFGHLAWLAPLMADGGAAGFALWYVTTVRSGRAQHALRLASHVCVGITVTLNVLSAHSPVGALWHAVPPVLWSVLVELYARHFADEWKAAHLDVAKIPLRLWITSPVESFRTWLVQARKVADPGSRAQVGAHDAAQLVLDLAAGSRVSTRRAHRLAARQLTTGAVSPAQVLGSAQLDPAQLSPAQAQQAQRAHRAEADRAKGRAIREGQHEADAVSESARAAQVEGLARRMVAYLGRKGKPVGASRVRCDLKPRSASTWDAALAHAIDHEWVVTGPGRKAGSTVLKLGSETPDET